MAESKAHRETKRMEMEVKQREQDKKRESARDIFQQQKEFRRGAAERKAKKPEYQLNKQIPLDDTVRESVELDSHTPSLFTPNDAPLNLNLDNNFSEQ